MQNQDQSIHVLASESDGYWYDQKSNKEVDLDVLFKIENIKSIEFDQEEKAFYILANKRNDLVGFFLIKFEETDPNKYTHLTMWKHRLDIGDASLNIIRSYDA